MDAGKRSNLIWAGVLAFFALIGLPIVQLLVVEPLQTNSLLLYYSPAGLKISDFVNFYYAGWMVLQGKAALVYDHATRMEMSNRLVAPFTVGEPLYCGYLPFVFVLMVPFALLPLVPAYFFWCLVTLAFGAGMLILFLRNHMRWQPRHIALFVLVVLWSLPSVLNFRLGQVVWLLLGLDVLFFWGMLARRDRMAGIALGLSAVKPQYTLVLIAAAVGCRRWRLLAIALATLLGLVAAAVATLGWQTVIAYPTLLTHTETVDSAITVMMCVRPLLAAVLPHALALQINFFLLAGGMLLVGWLWRKSNDDSEDKQRWLVAVTMVVALLFSPHTHCHDALLLAIPAAMMRWDKVFQKASDWQTKTAILLLGTMPLLGYVFYAMPNTGAVSRWPFILVDFLLLLSGLLYIGRKTTGVLQREL